MRTAVTVSVNREGKTKMVSGPEVDAESQRKNFLTATPPEGGKLMMFASGSDQPKVKKG